MRLYIAGPMSNLPDLNYPTFNATAERLASRGHEVYNPATTFNGTYFDLPYDIWLREAIRLVSMANGIVLLDGWWNSKGALTESHIGLSLGMPFYQENDGNLYQLSMTYPQLIREMHRYYVYYREGKPDAAKDGLSQSADRDSRQAESGEDNRYGSVALPAPKLEAALIR